MPLTDKKIKALRPRSRHYYVTHKNCLQLSVEPSGTHFWRFHFRYNGIMQTLCIGKYPAVSIAEAENTVTRARGYIEAGINPRFIEGLKK